MGRKRICWTDEMLQAEALKYETRVDFYRGNHSAYHAAYCRGILDKICGHMILQRIDWTSKSLREESLKYKTRADFQHSSKPAYETARRRGILDKICGHMRGNVQIKWTDEMLQEEALKYETRIDFKSGSNHAYQAVKRRGILDKICGHMIDGSPTDNDVIYIWRIKGERYKRKNVYKVGITSARLDDYRITSIAEMLDVDAEIIILQEVTGKASDIESKILRLGEHPGYNGFNGATEFRALTPKQLAKAIHIIENHGKA